MKHHPATGESSFDTASRILRNYRGNAEDAQEAITVQIAWALEGAEREFWEEVLGQLGTISGR